ncbi:MAG: dihydrodipicolinate reductase C-terminal domain-containing protein [Patescibacteria group bacterium]|jgi:4-hydroxy-tetrahydrodipicolinate reductase
METKKIKVAMSGLPGKVAYPIAEAVAASPDMELLPYAFTGAEVDVKSVVINGQPVWLIKPDARVMLLSHFDFYENPDVIIDFTAPEAVEKNVDFYTVNELPFVMGTTFGGFIHLQDYINSKVSQSFINAVVAPNMAKDVVLVQAMFEWAAENFPGALKEFSAKTVESHQKTKSDTSGTAKAIVASLRTLGVDCSVEGIKKIRKEEAYEVMGIPKEYWDGHGWHTYPLTKNDGNVFLEFTHNINGRQPYVDGTLDAVRFLHRKMNPEKKNVGNVFSMVDILREGYAE